MANKQSHSKADKISNLSDDAHQTQLAVKWVQCSDNHQAVTCYLCQIPTIT